MGEPDDAVYICGNVLINLTTHLYEDKHVYVFSNNNNNNNNNYAVGSENNNY